jgi:hypothetical protein
MGKFKRILFVAGLVLGLAVIAGADTTLLSDTFTDTNSVVISSHTADTNITGHVYTLLHGSVNSSECDIQGNKLSMIVQAGNYPAYYLDLGSAATTGTITYSYMATIPSSVASVNCSPYFGFLSQRTGSGSGTSVTAYAVLWKTDASYNITLNLMGVTLNAYGYLKTSSTIATYTGGNYPTKITANGNSICVYGDTSGTNATTLRIYYPTTLNNSNTEIYLANNSATHTIDDLTITQITPVPTATPTPSAHSFQHRGRGRRR